MDSEVLSGHCTLLMSGYVLRLSPNMPEENAAYSLKHPLRRAEKPLRKPPTNALSSGLLWPMIYNIFLL